MLKNAAPSERVKIDKEVARIALLRAWRIWADINAISRPAKDQDAHAFLRMMRSKHPKLFTFKVPAHNNAHQTAFFWLLDAGVIAL